MNLSTYYLKRKDCKEVKIICKQIESFSFYEYEVSVKIKSRFKKWFTSRVFQEVTDMMLALSSEMHRLTTVSKYNPFEEVTNIQKELPTFSEFICLLDKKEIIYAEGCHRQDFARSLVTIDMKYYALFFKTIKSLKLPKWHSERPMRFIKVYESVHGVEHFPEDKKDTFKVIIDYHAECPCSKKYLASINLYSLKELPLLSLVCPDCQELSYNQS